ncbi:MAG TPA: hypothetical protein V6C52_02230 [Coleofasciculaceae cyanobacterium]|jgi:hypothetical protein
MLPPALRFGIRVHFDCDRLQYPNGGKKLDNGTLLAWNFLQTLAEHPAILKLCLENPDKDVFMTAERRNSEIMIRLSLPSEPGLFVKRFAPADVSFPEDIEEVSVQVAERVQEFNTRRRKGQRDIGTSEKHNPVSVLPEYWDKRANLPVLHGNRMSTDRKLILDA